MVHFQITKISKALIAANIDDDEIDEELERFREKRLKDVAKEEQDANAILVSCFTSSDQSTQLLLTHMFFAWARIEPKLI